MDEVAEGGEQMAGTSGDGSSPQRLPKQVPGGEQHHATGNRGGSLFTGVGVVCDTVTRLTGVDGAAAAVFAPSQSRELVYASDAISQQIDDLQFTLGEGPCLDAYRSSAPQLCPRLDSGPAMDRWPGFCIDAADIGARAVFAYPIIGPERPLGVLELYRRTPGDLDPDQHESAALCSASIGQTLLSSLDMHVAMAIDTAAAVDAAESGPEYLSRSFSRVGVYMAAGMVAVQLGVTADEGLDRLRAYTYSNGRSINAVAADIVARRLSLRGMRDGSKDGI
jgi:hypothetical protein